MSVLITAIVIASIVALATAFWDEIHQWIKGILQRIEKNFVVSTKVFIKKMREAFVEIVKIWSKKGNKWYETSETREVSESEVPEEIKNKAKNIEVDITEDYEREIGELVNK